MKKVILIIMLLFSIPIMAISIYALDFSGSVVGSYTLDHIPIVDDFEHYEVRIKVDEVTLPTDMTNWYNAYDSVYATPHVYYFSDPVTLLEDGFTIYDEITIMHVDYDIAGASESTIYFYDDTETLLYSIDMDLLDDGLLLKVILPNSFVFDGSYDYSIIDDFEHTLWNWDFSFGLLDWYDLSEDENTWSVGVGGSFDGVLGVQTIDSNSMLENYGSLNLYDTYYIRYTSNYVSGTGYISGFDENININRTGTFEYIEMAYEEEFRLIALDNATEYYIDDIVVLNLTSTFGSTHPSIEDISFMVDVWLGLEVIHFVNWYDYDNTLLKSEYVLNLEDGNPPTLPNRIGYTFTGWDLDYTSIETDLDLTATYSHDEYTVTFETNGGNLIPTQTLHYGDPIEKPTDPTKEGYIFVGWYRNENLTLGFNFNTQTMPSNDITLYAKWTTTLDVNINDWLEEAGFNTTFYKVLLTVVVIIVVTIVFALFKTHPLLLLIIGSSILLLGIALGFIPTWITILLVIIVFFLFYMVIKGVRSDE